MWYEKSGDAFYKEQAQRFLNFATYMTYPNGVVAVGPTWPSSWFSDGYGDYIKHFHDALAAVPEWAPADRDHLLRSSSIVQEIEYGRDKISYRTFDERASELLRVTEGPVRITSGGVALKAGAVEYEPLEKGGILKISHEKNTVTIYKQ